MARCLGHFQSVLTWLLYVALLCFIFSTNDKVSVQWSQYAIASASLTAHGLGMVKAVCASALGSGIRIGALGGCICCRIPSQPRAAQLQNLWS